MFGRKKNTQNTDANESQLEWLILSCGKFACDFKSRHGQEIQTGNLIYESKRIAEQWNLHLSDESAKVVALGSMVMTVGEGRELLDELVVRGWLEEPSWKKLNHADADRLKYVCARFVQDFEESEFGHG